MNHSSMFTRLARQLRAGSIVWLDGMRQELAAYRMESGDVIGKLEVYGGGVYEVAPDDRIWIVSEPPLRLETPRI